VGGERFDYVITLCDRLREICPEFPGPAEAIHWSVPDPAAADGGYPAFRAVAADLRTRIGFLLARISDESDPVQEVR
jgi:ArsR family transcriptional regulator, arsenate/arsenite/antimonite-responsive transcriptional repressor / arsenate reductase (thioredoxin)